MRRISWIDQGMRSDVLALRSTLFFLGAGLLARCWMAAIMAKASMTSET